MTKPQPLSNPVRFGISIAILGAVMLTLPPEVAGILGLILVLGALVGSGIKNPGEPIKALTALIYGG